MKGADESLLERPATGTEGPGRSAGTIKSILFLVHDDDQLACRLQTALSIARTCSAHLQCLQVIPVEAYATVDAVGTFVNAETLALLEEEGKKLRERMEARLRNEDVAWSYEMTSEPLIPELPQGCSSFRSHSDRARAAGPRVRQKWTKPARRDRLQVTDAAVHSGHGRRAGEFLFGGVTRTLLREFSISLVMAH